MARALVLLMLVAVAVAQHHQHQQHQQHQQHRQHHQHQPHQQHRQHHQQHQQHNQHRQQHQQQQQQHQQQPQQQQQQQKKEEPKNGALLSLPVPEMCKNRPKNMQFGNHNYYFSWDLPENQEGTGVDANGKPTGKKVNWLEARNGCRTRCMDAISIETEAENDWVKNFIRERRLDYIWTSGRLCDFTGCDQRADLQPVDIFGWFWSATNTKIAPTNSTHPIKDWPNRPWSNTGHYKRPQPDNAEFSINKTPESCLGVLNNLYEDGIQWHDIACYHPKPYICEDSEVLLNYARGLLKENFE